GRRRRRIAGRLAGAYGDGLRFRPGRARFAADAEGAFSGVAPPAHEPAARCLAQGGDAGRRQARRTRGVVRYFPGSLNGAFMPSGSGATNVLSVIDTIA